MSDTTTPPATPPWHRQPCDSEISFRTFCHYRDMPLPRRLASLCFVGVPTEEVYRWHREHDWTKRAAAWDAHKDAVRLEEREKALRLSTSQVTEAHQDLLSGARELCERELAKVLHRSRSSVAAGDVMSVGDLQRMIDLTVKLERLTRDQPTENVHTAFDLSGLTSEELTAFRTLLAKVTPQ